MKKLSKLKLNMPSDANLRDKEMNGLRGGDYACSASCYWVDQGGSSSYNNAVANYYGGYTSPQGNNCYWFGINDAGNNEYFDNCSKC